MDFMQSIKISQSGLAAQSLRMKTISENIANADSVQTPSGGPYRRKMVHFQSVLDQKTGGYVVKTGAVRQDMKTPMGRTYDPSSPLADTDGFVSKPNVDPLVENLDLKAAARAYEANLSAIDSSKEMMVRSLSLLR